MTIFSICFTSLIGLGINGPNSFLISTSTPIACGTTRISEKRIAASVPICSIGIKVILAASSGVLQRVKKSYFSFSFIKSGKYLPACLIIQTGGLETLSPFSASSKSLFFITL